MATILLRIASNTIPLLLLSGFLLTAGPLDAQETNYVNQTGETVQVYQQPGAGSPLQFLLTLPPNSSFRDVGPRISPLEFRFGSGEQVQQVNAGPGQVTLVRHSGPVDPPGVPDKVYLNETGEVVHVYQQQGMAWPQQTPPAFVQSLQPGQDYRVSGAQTSPVTFQLSSGFGQIQQVQKQTLTGEFVTALLKVGQPGPAPAPPGGMETVYLNETGEVVHIYQQQGAWPSGQTFVQSLFSGQSYRTSGPQISPLSFRLSSGYGHSIQQQHRQTQFGPVIALTKVPVYPVNAWPQTTWQQQRVWQPVQNRFIPGYPTPVRRR